MILLGLFWHLKGKSDLPVTDVANQIAARQKAKSKLPVLHQNKRVLFPPPLAMEQCSSEATAKYKANLVSGNTLVDLTGGFGVDTYFLSRSFQRTRYVEQQAELCALARYNFEQLKQEVEVQHAEAVDFLAAQQEKIDCIYLDPARRNPQQQKVYQWADCQPDLVKLLPVLFQKGAHIMVKAAPMLDVTKAVADLQYHVKAVHIVEWDGEVKELLFLIDEGRYSSPDIKVVQLSNNGLVGKAFEATHAAENTATLQTALPKKYLYEPSPALMKSGLFNMLSGKIWLT